ncbi:hypothetical protein Btru_004116 [Bulinus truncatus]|nr:hypothetical protein Btru_004116 [Bulinus truncatus]
MAGRHCYKRGTFNTRWLSVADTVIREGPLTLGECIWPADTDIRDGPLTLGECLWPADTDIRDGPLTLGECLWPADTDIRDGPLTLEEMKMKEEKVHSESDQTSNLQKSNQSNKSNSKPPKSKTTDSKIIRDILTSVRKKVKTFKKSHLVDRSRYNFAKCHRSLQEDILPAWDVKAEKVKDFDEFLKLTLRKEAPEHILESDEYIDLISIGKRAQEFHTFYSDAKRQLLNCMDKHVMKSCTSLKEMAGSEVIISVEDYAQHISQHKADIEVKWEELEKNLETYQSFLKPFTNYIDQCDGHTEAMNKVCNNVLEVCKLIEKWVIEDGTYPDKLAEEYESNKKLKENLVENLQQLENKKIGNIEQIEKLHKRETRAQHNYTSSRKYKHVLQMRQEKLEERRERLNNKLEKKRSEQSDETKESNSAGQTDAKKGRPTEAEIQKLEADILDVDRQLKKLKRNFKPVNDRTYEHKVDAVTFRHQKEEIQKENIKVDEEMRSVNERISKLNQQNNILMKIRDMKTSDEAFKRNMRDKQKQEAAQSDGSHQLTQACQYAASIGKQWRILYYRLPFVPFRDVDKRDHDVDLLDYLGAKHDVTEDELAVKSLFKWQMFHRKATVGELVSALKETKFTRLASDIELMQP